MIGLPFMVVDANQISNHIERENAVDDPRVMAHLASIISVSARSQHTNDITHLSNLVKQTEPPPKPI